MDINEEALLAQAKTGFEGFKTGDGIPAEYISMRTAWRPTSARRPSTRRTISAR